eukprot:4137760-Amphidinium_carterae.2
MKTRSTIPRVPRGVLFNPACMLELQRPLDPRLFISTSGSANAVQDPQLQKINNIKSEATHPQRKAPLKQN